MYKMNVCSTYAVEGDAVKAFFKVLYGAVHYLIQHPVLLQQPCLVPFRDWETRPFTHRVHLYNNTVCKLYDTKFDMDPSRGFEALKCFPCVYLEGKL